MLRAKGYSLSSQGAINMDYFSNLAGCQAVYRSAKGLES